MNLLALYVFAMLNSFAVSDPAAVDTTTYPQGYFKSPLDLPLTIVGNFGEPRKLHFHTGLDFRTNSEEGHKVFAAADGYVSRIKVSSGGYGNALYITHPNGYTTVYGHLQRYSEKIMERLRKEQYAKESFAVDISLPPGEITVKQGEQIALSGNTGGSGGPHLHFEVRDGSERPYNPLLFGIKLDDNVKPTISGVKLYAMDDALKYTTEGSREKVSLKNGLYAIANGAIKVNSKKVGFSINTFDKLDANNSIVGVYNITVFDNDKMIYEYEMDRIAFTETRNVLSQIDYPIFIHEGHKAFHKCFVEPGNRTPVYSNLNDRGVVDLSDGLPHNLHAEVSDYAGNVSQLMFTMQYDSSSTMFKPTVLKYAAHFKYDRDNVFDSAGFAVKVPGGSLYDDAYLNYTINPPADGVYSKIYQLGNSDIEVADWFDVSVTTEGLPAALTDKAGVMYKDNSGSTAFKGGKFSNGYISTRTRDFGQYYIVIDTTPPVVKPLNFTPGKNVRSIKKLVFRITDNKSGIDDFDTYIDGKWVVADYDGKTSSITHTIANNLAAGTHIFKVVVTDERKNKTEYSVKFLW
jgi:hypothetical protein